MHCGLPIRAARISGKSKSTLIGHEPVVWIFTKHFTNHVERSRVIVIRGASFASLLCNQHSDPVFRLRQGHVPSCIAEHCFAQMRKIQPISTHDDCEHFCDHTPQRPNVARRDFVPAFDCLWCGIVGNSFCVWCFVERFELGDTKSCHN